MKFKPLSVALALGVLCAVYMLVVTYYPVVSEAVLGAPKGAGLRGLMENLYPYYQYGTWYAPLLGIVYGFIDGFIFGILFGWLYNAFAKK